MDLCLFIQDMISLYRVIACLILGPCGDGNRKGRRRTGGKRKSRRGWKRCPSGFTPPLLASSYSLSSTHQPPQFLECITLRWGPREDPAHNRCSAILLTESWGPWEGPKALICVGRRERRMPAPSPGQVISWDCESPLPWSCSLLGWFP